MVIITLVLKTIANIFGEKGSKIAKRVIVTLFLKTIANIFDEKWSKIAKNGDHNIGF
jgi:hypothetical protein